MPEFTRLTNKPEATRHRIVIQDVTDKWLVKKKSKLLDKKASSARLEVLSPELANLMIREGVHWGGRPHECELYDSSQKVK